MVEVVIRNAEAVAHERVGTVWVTLGQWLGARVEERVRDRIAERLHEELDAAGVEATISNTGPCCLTITVRDASGAGREAGGALGELGAELGRRVAPGAVDTVVADRIAESLRREGVDADVSVR